MSEDLSTRLADDVDPRLEDDSVKAGPDQPPAEDRSEPVDEELWQPEGEAGQARIYDSMAAPDPEPEKTESWQTQSGEPLFSDSPVFLASDSPAPESECEAAAPELSWGDELPVSEAPFLKQAFEAGHSEAALEESFQETFRNEEESVPARSTTLETYADAGLAKNPEPVLTPNDAGNPAWGVAAATAVAGAQIPLTPSSSRQPWQQPVPAFVRPLPSRFSSFWPTTVLALSFLAFLASQFVYQVKAANQFVKAKAEREPQVTAATKVEADLQSLITDLITLAKTDTGAQKVIDKYQIKQVQPPK